MTDETRFRASRAYAQPQPVPQRTGSGVRRFEDPLAELARLIGQDDPFADFVAHKASTEKRRSTAGNNGYPSPSVDPRHEEREYYARGQEEHEPDFQQHSGQDEAHAGNGAQDHEDAGFDDGAPNGHAEARPVRQAQTQPEPRQRAQGFRQDTHYENEFDREFADQLPPQQPRGRFSRAPENDYEYPEMEPRQRQAPPAHSYRPHDPYQQNGQGARNHSFDQQNGYMDDQGQYYEDGRYPAQGAYAEHPQQKRAPAAKAYDGRGQQKGRSDGYDPAYADDAQLPAHTDEFYEETPKKRGKNWLIIGTAAACIVALAGTGVFAYRAVFGTSGAPKTIKAETAPTKVSPTNTQAAAEPGKNNDRVGFDAPPSGERIVSRQEEPVGRSPAPGGSPFAAVPQAAPPPRQQAQATGPMAAEGEPKRVRTYSVRADGSVIGDQARAGATGSTRPGQVSNAPMSINSYAERDNASARDPIAAPPPQQQQARVATQQSSSPAPSSGNPWADISNAPQRAAPPPQQQASLPPSGPPPVQRAPAPTIAVQAPPPAGSYVVQVASQKTEQEAQATWQQVQGRYSSVLGGQSATIRRVNLGERGTFYRAQLGPFNDRSRASEICESLKAAGGECIIQRN